MRILGIDPGVATTGWSIVDFDKGNVSVVDFGVISTHKSKPHAERLEEIFKDLTEIIHKFAPERAGIELLLFTNNAKTAMAVGEARGVILLCLQQAGLDIIQLTPPQVKSSVTGNGRAGKKQVQENVKNICKLDEIPKPDDAADAIAIAIGCFDRIKLNSQIAG